MSVMLVERWFKHQDRFKIMYDIDIDGFFIYDTAVGRIIQSTFNYRHGAILRCYNLTKIRSNKGGRKLIMPRSLYGNHIHDPLNTIDGCMDGTSCPDADTCRKDRPEGCPLLDDQFQIDPETGLDKVIT